MLPKKIRHIISKLPLPIQGIIGEVISFFEEALSKKDARIKELEDQLSKNSQNSSKPPSTDPNYAKPSHVNGNNGREKTGKKAGGQKGHKGSNLKITDTPDHIVHHQVTTCEQCGANLEDILSTTIQRRQVYDIPPLHLQVTQHESEVKVCSCGCRNTNFPAQVSHYVQYGAHLKSLITYLQSYQLLPYERTAELIQDLFFHQVSTGTLHNIQKQAHERLEEFDNTLKAVMSNAPLAGFDETGFRIEQQCWWLHSCSTPQHAYYQVNFKRGKEAMDAIGILPKFEGIAIHDFWKSYFKYDCTHGLCNAHLLRELTFLHERHQQCWAEELIGLLLEMKQQKHLALQDQQTALCPRLAKELEAKYDVIVQKGLELNPLVKDKHKEVLPKKRGRPKKSKARNLLERLRDYKADILRFCSNFLVPFDNNFSERDIRMMKLKQKISGCFRSEQGATYFARMRSLIMSARKQGRNILSELIDIFQVNQNWKNIVYAE